MFNLIPYQNKNKLFIFLNFFLILTFFYFVGLALHEGSHIKLSDFELLKNLGKLDWEVFLKYFIFFQILSFFLLFYYSYKLFPLEKIKYLYPIIYFFCLNFSIGLGGTVTGNIAVILYALLAVGFIQLFNKKTKSRTQQNICVGYP